MTNIMTISKDSGKNINFEVEYKTEDKVIEKTQRLLKITMRAPNTQILLVAEPYEGKEKILVIRPYTGSDLFLDISGMETLEEVKSYLYDIIIDIFCDELID